MGEQTIRVSEVFGPTFQGEGPSLGRRAAFVRLTDCNLDCSWCDTPYTWDWQGKNGVAFSRQDESTKRTVSDVVEQVAAMNVPLAVVTGGEPLLRLDALDSLTSALRTAGMEVEVETNGTLDPVGVEVDRWNVSPKLSGSGVDPRRAIVFASLAALNATGRAWYKFVVTGRRDLDEVDLIVDAANLPRERVFVMPEGRTPTAIVEGVARLADDVIERGYNLTTRLHVLAWGDERGR